MSPAFVKKCFYCEQQPSEAGMLATLRRRDRNVLNARTPEILLKFVPSMFYSQRRALEALHALLARHGGARSQHITLFRQEARNRVSSPHIKPSSQLLTSNTAKYLLNIKLLY